MRLKELDADSEAAYSKAFKTAQELSSGNGVKYELEMSAPASTDPLDIKCAIRCYGCSVDTFDRDFNQGSPIYFAAGVAPLGSEQLDGAVECLEYNGVHVTNLEKR